jgi:hypothetical protein
MAKVEMRRSGAQAADDLVRLVAEKKWSEVRNAGDGVCCADSLKAGVSRVTVQQL